MNDMTYIDSMIIIALIASFDIMTFVLKSEDVIIGDMLFAITSTSGQMSSWML